MKPIFLILAIFSFNVSYSCTCIGKRNVPLKDAMKGSDWVFTGKVTKIDTVLIEYDSIANFAFKEIWYTFLIETVYNGKKSITEIDVMSGKVDHDDCKFIFELNKSYIVYASYKLSNKWEKMKDQLATSVCTHTGVLTEDIRNELKGYD